MRDGMKPYFIGKVKRESERLAGKVPAGLSRGFYEFRPEGFLTETLIIVHFDLQFSYSESLSKNAEKILLRKYNLEMALQFTVDDLIQPIVKLSYLSSDGEMEVDDPSQTSKAEDDQDSDIEVLACNKEAQSFGPQAVAGRFMTTELPGGLDDLSIAEALNGLSSADNNYPPSDLVDLVFAQKPPCESFMPLNQQLIAHCSQLEPNPDTPQSPPIHEQGPYANNINDPWATEQYSYWPDNAHITGVAVSTSEACDEPNIVQHGDCYVCGKSLNTIKEELLFNFLKQTHIDGESYQTRLRRRNAFQAGMQAAPSSSSPGEGRKLPPVTATRNKWPPETVICLTYPESYHYD